MFAKLAVIFACWMVVCYAIGEELLLKGGSSYANVNLGLGGGIINELGGKLDLKEEGIIDYIAYPQYQFKYGVEDPKTGDYKSQSESRDGDVVKGEYTLLEPDGTIRTVKYASDKKNGFNAQVIRSGKAIHPEPQPIILSKYSGN